jgi:hypothetical protein
MSKVEIVEWVDAASGMSWVNKECLDDRDVERCWTIGVVMRETDRAIIMVPIGSSSDIRHEMAIPIGCITRRRQLTIKEAQHGLRDRRSARKGNKDKRE